MSPRLPRPRLPRRRRRKAAVEMPSQEPRRKHRLRRPRLRRRSRIGSPPRPRRRRLSRRPAAERGPALAALGGIIAAIGALLRTIGRALATAGSYIAEVGRELGLAIGDVGAGISAAWGGLDVYVRRRVALVAAALAAVVALWLFAVPALPCQYPGGDACPPADDAAGLVPSDALAYLHVDTDASSEQYAQAAAILARLPVLSSQIGGRLLAQVPAVGGSAPSVTKDVRPWLGDEAALALLPAAGAPQEIELLSVADRGLAERYQSQLAGPGSETIPYRGVKLVRGKGGVASTIVSGFLVIGTTAGAETAIDVETGAQGATALSDSPAAPIRDELSAQRVADAYLSPAGALAVAGRPTGFLAPLAPFVAPRSTNGVAIGLVAQSDGFELQIRSELDPERAAAKPGFFAAFPSVSPSLASQLPARTLAYFGIGHPGQAVSSLLAQVSTEEPGLARALTHAVASAQEASGVKLSGELRSALGAEGAIALERAPAGGAPYVLYVGTGIDPKQAADTLAGLERPIARSLGSSQGGGGAGFRTRDVAGVKVHSLDVSPAIRLSYAIVGKQFVVATNPIGIAAVAKRGGLDASPNYEAATNGLPPETSLLGYLDLRGLVTLGERAGLANDPAYATFSGDFHQLKALGLAVTATTHDLDTDGRLAVGSGPLQSRPPTNGANEPPPSAFR